MLIAIFASRDTQRQYASKLSGYLSSIGDCKPLVLWYKDLLKIKHWIKAIYTPVTSELDLAVVEVIKEKKNHPKHSKSSSIYWRFFEFIKSIESKLLYTSYHDQLLNRKVEQLVIWNGLKFRQRIAVIAAKKLSIPCCFIERGALPGTTTLDLKGINYLNSVPRDPAYYKNRNLKNTLVTEIPEAENSVGLPDNYIFIPFQVNVDSQITMFSPWIENMFSLVELLLEVEDVLGDSMPNVILKSHPSCEQCYQELFEKITKVSKKIFVINDVETSVLIKDSSSVITINSSVGMEALLMRKKVIVLGKAFYNIKGITLSAGSTDELIENIKRVPNWEPNEYLTSSFLDYLKCEYVVKGSWHKPNLEHFQNMAQRLSLLVDSRTY
ncbi:MAG: capsular polysaccharide export protein [Oleispira sp.]|jgi:capsular polysaccharide export protein